jgi:hypothetical protein
MINRSLSLARLGLVASLTIVVVLIAIHVSTLAAGTSTQPSAQPTGEQTNPQPSLDAPQGVVTVAATIGPGVISKEQAVATALAHYQSLSANARVDAFLGTTTDSTTAGVVSDRLVWIVHLFWHLRGCQRSCRSRSIRTAA